MELLEKQLELNNEIRAKEELQRRFTQTQQQLTENEMYVAYTSLPLLCFVIRELTLPWVMGLLGRAWQFEVTGFPLSAYCMYS